MIRSTHPARRGSLPLAMLFSVALAIGPVQPARAELAQAVPTVSFCGVVQGFDSEDIALGTPTGTVLVPIDEASFQMNGLPLPASMLPEGAAVAVTVPASLEPILSFAGMNEDVLGGPMASASFDQFVVASSSPTLLVPIQEVPAGANGETTVADAGPAPPPPPVPGAPMVPFAPPHYVVARSSAYLAAHPTAPKTVALLPEGQAGFTVPPPVDDVSAPVDETGSLATDVQATPYPSDDAALPSSEAATPYPSDAEPTPEAQETTYSHPLLSTDQAYIPPAVPTSSSAYDPYGYGAAPPITNYTPVTPSGPSLSIGVGSPFGYVSLGYGTPGYGMGVPPIGYGSPYGMGIPPIGYGSPYGIGIPPIGYGSPYGMGIPPLGYGTPYGMGLPTIGMGLPTIGMGLPPIGYGAGMPPMGYGYGAPGPYGVPGYGYGTPYGYGAPPIGYGSPYGVPPMGYGYGSPYGAPPMGYGYGSPYGVPPMGYGYGSPYGAPPMGYGYGNPYGAPPMGYGYGSPYGVPPMGYGYGSQYGVPPMGYGYGSPYGVPPMGYGMPYSPYGFGPSLNVGLSLGNGLGIGFTTFGGGGLFGGAPFGAPYGMPYGPTGSVATISFGGLNLSFGNFGSPFGYGSPYGGAPFGYGAPPIAYNPYGYGAPPMACNPFGYGAPPMAGPIGYNPFGCSPFGMGQGPVTIVNNYYMNQPGAMLSPFNTNPYSPFGTVASVNGQMAYIRTANGMVPIPVSNLPGATLNSSVMVRMTNGSVMSLPFNQAVALQNAGQASMLNQPLVPSTVALQSVPVQFHNGTVASVPLSRALTLQSANRAAIVGTPTTTLLARPAMHPVLSAQTAALQHAGFTVPAAGQSLGVTHPLPVPVGHAGFPLHPPVPAGITRVTPVSVPQHMGAAFHPVAPARPVASFHPVAPARPVASFHPVAPARP
ncbi:MAG: hypothetical protein ACYCW6_03305, partial [Candidatus Xenobia bacterium]